MLPVYEEFNFNLNNINRIINKDVSVNIRPLVQSLAKELDRLMRDQQMNEEGLSKTVTSLINNFKAVKGVDYLSLQFESAQRADTAEKNYRNILSLFRNEIKTLQADHPHLKGA
jgi:hypothetical protein